MVRVLFVCMGNICRSPMAEAVFRHKVRAAGLEDRIEADSAGTGDWHAGSPAHPGTRRLLARNDIACDDHCARQITPEDFHEFDYILTMDEDNLSAVRALARSGGRAKIAPLMDFAPHANAREVPDPYYTGGFEGVYALVDEATTGLLAAIRREHIL